MASPQSISDRLIPFNQGGKWGFCNAQRDLVIACEYDWVQCFRNTQNPPLALVRQGTFPQEWRYGMIHPSGEVCIPLEYSNLEPFSCGLAKMRRFGKTLYGFLDPLGRQVTKHEFETAQSFCEGRAYVSLPTRRRVQEHGFIDTQGDMRLSGRLLFDDARPFRQGRAVVTHYAARGYFYSYLTLEGGFLTVGKPSRNLTWFCSASCFGDERALVYGELTGFAIIDTQGAVVADLGYEFDEAYPASEGLIRVVKQSDTGFLDLQGREVIPCMLDYARVRDFCGGLAAFQETEDGLWGFFDRNLEVVVPPKYNQVADFCEGLAAVKCGDAYAVVNAQGHEVIGPRFSYVGCFDGGLALAQSEGSKFYIDSQGVEYRSPAGEF